MFIGNKKNVNILERSIGNGKIAQAYLFFGPEGVGKFTLAKKFAKRIIEGTSDDLTIIDDENRPVDLMVIEPEIEEVKGVEKKRDISIEQIRDAQKELALFPYSGKLRVLIVNDAERLSLGAQNALLKSLEEPNPTSIMVLVAHDSSRILDTVKSRTLKVCFQLVSDKDFDVIGDLNEKIKSLASGRPGTYFDLSLDSDKFERLMEVVGKMDNAGKLSVADRFELAEKWAKNVSETIGMLNLYIGWLHAGDKKYENLKKINRIREALGRLNQTNANPKLVWENMLLDI